MAPTAKTRRKSPKKKATKPSPKKLKSDGRDYIEIMDTTLRDGEQAEGVLLMPTEKLVIARHLLHNLNVDRIEVASAHVSAGELTAVKNISSWARKEKLLDRVEILGFVDRDKSVEWARGAGVKVINLLTKGSEKHCREQLRKEPREHWDAIAETIRYGASKKIRFNVYLEDWSNGMILSPEYVNGMVACLSALPVERVMLCDTLGILNPIQVKNTIEDLTQTFPTVRFDFHGHNDYGLATANTLQAVLAGARGIHCTVNGMGERAGNTSLDEAVVCIKDHAKRKTGINEKALKEVSHLVEVYSGRRIAVNKPIVGENVFTQTAGIHADGDRKGNLYESLLKPARFGRSRTYTLGKLMGKASLDFNLDKMRIKLTAEQKKLVMAKIIELGDQKKTVTPEDLPFIVSNVLERPEHRIFHVEDYMITSNRGLFPTATVKVTCRGDEFQASACGDGGYDAFMKALRSLEKKMKITVPVLEDYEVHIPPGGRTDALVETSIKWQGGLKTRAVDSDQLAAAIEATVHAVNIVNQNG